jgi:hypothetical protein
VSFWGYELRWTINDISNTVGEQQESMGF